MRPTVPAMRLRCRESCPREGLTVWLCTTSRGTLSAPALSWITMFWTSSGGMPSIIPELEMAPLITGEEMTCLSMTIDIGWPRWELVYSKKRPAASPWSSKATT